MILYAVLLIGAVLVLPKLETSPWRFVVVVLPVVPVLYGMRALIRYLGQLDELGQRIQLQGIAFAAGMVAILTFTYGFLELAGLPPVSLIWVLPLMVMLWGIGTALASRKYE
jgi:hypothetical protein